MINIGIDGNEANVDRRVGIGEYAFEIINEFQKLKTQSARFIIYLYNPASCRYHYIKVVGLIIPFRPFHLAFQEALLVLFLFQKMLLHHLSLKS